MDAGGDARNIQHAPDRDRGLTAGLAAAAAWIAQAGLCTACVRPLKRRYSGAVILVRTREKGHFIIKTGDETYDAWAEAEMLSCLREAGLPTPRIVDTGKHLLVLESVSSGPFTAATARSVGRSLALLHNTAQGAVFGFNRPTFFGALPMTNLWCNDWPVFLVQQRILCLATAARSRARLSNQMSFEIESFAMRCISRFPSATRSSLLHGDIWANNVLETANGPTFVDPSSFYGDAGYELAFMLRYLAHARFALEGYLTVSKPHHTFWSVQFPVYRMCFDLAHLALFGGGRFESRLQFSLQAARSVFA